MWLQDDGFIDKVKEWRQSYNVNGSPDYILAQKLKHLKTDINKWNKEEYGKVEVRASKVLDELLILEAGNRRQNKDSRKNISDFESQTGNSEVGQSRGGLVETKVQMFVVERG
ncbi:hypothetical protein MTR67_002280 [Solanum verrucosum]|uniref:Uncharacterized protein n=1 Tax=Solanum verrucosum TaxID=315347 RepID=A0AAF0PTD3_SOLVR|nr:hypothetical protein MTR67_002280 [Solanum verrucosum]